MANERITRELIRRRKSESRSKVREIYDDQLRGFGIRISVTGKVTYIYRWTTDGGQRRVVIGPESMSVDEARDAVKKLAISGSADPINGSTTSRHRT